MKREHMGRNIVTLVAITLMAAGASAQTAADKCTAAKNKASGKYAACLQNAEAQLVLKSDAEKYAAAVAKCGDKLTGAFDKAEDKAAADLSACPSVDNDGVVKTFMTDVAGNLAAALSGTGKDPSCGGDSKGSGVQLLSTGQTTCYDPSGAVIACAGTGQDGETQTGVVRSYTDNGDATITDNNTGLMWERQCRQIGGSSACPSEHNAYSFLDFTQALAKVAALNTANFAGHNDWRLPNVNELFSLVSYSRTPTIDTTFDTACTTTCDVSVCSCTNSTTYWTSTSAPGYGQYAVRVYFGNGSIAPSGKTSADSIARVVRGPSK